jgi:hypothetical protein
MLPHDGVRSAHSERREEMSTVCQRRVGKNETGNLVFCPTFVYRKFVYLLCEFDFGAPRSLYFSSLTMYTLCELNQIPGF